MNEKIITVMTDFMAQKSKKEYKKGTDDYEILRYGTAVIYYNTTKTVLLIAVSLILKILPYTLAFMAVFGGLRRFAHGIHLKSNTLCTIIGFANYIAGIYISVYFTIGIQPTIIIYAVCYLLNIVYAPSPTENTPIDDKQKLPLKIGVISVMTVLFIIMLVIGENAYRNIILIATIIETLYILPVTYKIFYEKRG